MPFTTSSTRSSSSIKPLHSKENYITWSIKIKNVLLRNNNVVYIRNGSRAEKPSIRYLDKYNNQLNQYDIDLEVYNAAVITFEAFKQHKQVSVHLALPRKPNKAKGKEKKLRI